MCPSQEDLRRFLDEELGEVEQAAVDAHLQDCEVCSKLLLSMTDEGAAEIIEALHREPLTPPRPRPPAPDPDSARQAGLNLLFGVLALQNNFITRDDLLGAFTAWVADKARPLAQLLVDRGALDQARRALLEALEVEHLKQHGGDPEASLALVSSLGSVREGLERLDDADLRASLVAAGPRPAGSGGDAAATVTYTPPSHRAGGRFRILRFHKQGGLGRVYIARDEELGREVALKEIRPDKAAEGDLRGRFILEAEINGGLEHPGIVPVYSLGTYDDGRPFYAMRFVEGDSLMEAIAVYHQKHPRPDPGAVEFRKLLGRFVDVCEAIAFAHSKGVLHRDLTPQNVMLGRYGETLLIDWGLAKATGRHAPAGPETAVEAMMVPPSGSGHAPTRGPMGTPAYMSPEQADGAVEAMGPATDVYGLGAILFALLTGKPPVDGGGTLDEVLERAQCGTIRRPQSLNPNVPRSLEAVCLMALAREPSGRYPTARALANDIEHWLADEPVSAWCEPLVRRLGRWARHHKPVVAGAAALLITAVVALSIGLVLVRRAEARAEENYHLALATVERLTTQISLRNEPDMEPMREELLKTARDYYYDFSKRQNEDRGARIELARALNLLACITNQLSSPSHALEYSREAVAVQEDLARDQRTRRDLLRGLANYLDVRGQLESHDGHPDLAELSYTRAIQIYRDLVRSDPSDGVCRLYLGMVLKNLGHCQVASRGREEAEKSYHEALAIFEALERSKPPFPKLTPDLRSPDHELTIHLASAHASVGDLYAGRGQQGLAEGHYRKNLEINEGLFHAHPDSQDAQFYIGMSYMRQSRIHAASQRWEQAESFILQSIQLWEILALNHPAARSNRDGLREALDHMCRVAIARGRPKDAEEALLRLKTLFESMVRARQSQPAYKLILAEILIHLGSLKQDRGDIGRAVQWLKELVDLLTGLAKTYPSYPQDKLIVDAAKRLVEVLGGEDDPGALEILASVIRAIEPLQKQGPDSAGVRAALCKLHQARGHRLVWSDQLPEALREWESALGLAEGPERDELLLEQAYTLGNDTEEHERVADLADKLSRSPAYSTEHYELGCLYALAARGAGKRQELPSREKEAIVQRYIARALVHLHHAETQAYFLKKGNLENLRTNPELDAIRSNEGFKALLKRCSSRAVKDTADSAAEDPG